MKFLEINPRKVKASPNKEFQIKKAKVEIQNKKGLKAKNKTYQNLNTKNSPKNLKIHQSK